MLSDFALPHRLCEQLPRAAVLLFLGLLACAAAPSVLPALSAAEPAPGVFWPADPGGRLQAARGQAVHLRCLGDRTLRRPGYLFSGHGSFCERAGGAEIRVGGDLDLRQVHDLAYDGEGVWAATYGGLFHSDGGPWERAAELGGWHVYAVPGEEGSGDGRPAFELAFPTYGQPTAVDPDWLRNPQQAALEEETDGFYAYPPDHFHLWFYGGEWAGGEEPSLPRLLEHSCSEGSVRTPREGLFECAALPSGDSIWDLLWALEIAGEPAPVLLYSRGLDAEALERMRGSLRPR